MFAKNLITARLYNKFKILQYFKKELANLFKWDAYNKILLKTKMSKKTSTNFLMEFLKVKRLI